VYQGTYHRCPDELVGPADRGDTRGALMCQFVGALAEGFDAKDSPHMGMAEVQWGTKENDCPQQLVRRRFRYHHG
jgi:hypothetical protein